MDSHDGKDRDNDKFPEGCITRKEHSHIKIRKKPRIGIGIGMGILRAG